MSLPDVAELDLATKVGQLFVVGFEGPEPTEDLRELLTDYRCGNVIYFSRNIDSPEQVAELSRELQTIATEAGPEIPLFVTADQEGGVVSRTDWGTEPPSQMSIGAGRDADLARSVGGAVGAELASIGVNFDLTPVLDVNNNPDNPVIGVRSFGEEPELVGDLGAAMADGMQSEGVLACGKHFPGHGDTSADSHHSLPVVDHDRERLDAVELAPFRRAIDAGIDAIMTTHVSFPTITGDDELPATVSRDVQTGLLREQLGFDGLVVTDGMEMNAIADEMGTPEGCVQAVEAGCDLLLVCHTPAVQKDSVEAVIDAVESGRIDESRIDDAVERVLEYKERRGVGQQTPSLDRWEATSDRSREVGREVAAAGITVARDRNETIPFDTGRPLHLVGFPGGRASPAEDDRYEPTLVADALEAGGFDVELHEVETADALPSFEGDEQVVLATYNAAGDDEQVRAVERLDEAVDAFAALVVRNPYDLARFPDVSTAVSTYDYTPATLSVTGEILAGRRRASGRLPVTIAGFEAEN
ncbi:MULTISPECIES: beta-N-acetylhexosaminidase [Halomicrobium]|uniref:Glycoside hydrolase family 3 domain protein n=2 Tax=Halomicrobium mukohataei TaxID=57705 RepID=C7P2G4_HALMD|nr:MULTISPECIES: beta-N-acetylhexosaminidase [Halomicrobium]ACV49279.1 glycoside hydrolase family 3 domain protein [Halomicrobium mukohataei DSM 12286]QCD64679.1 beta-N-acetylhexosaminidase [Halomicrobium mukohataei]QFR19486.1 beta-N-acetylhexosaminidase [Halomicrobium sp. ZPS1]